MDLSVCFVMDPIEDVLLDKDTTLVLMLECQRRGHRVAVVETPGLFLEGGRLYGRIREVALDLSARPFFSILRRGIEPLDAFDVVWMRKDPPFDTAYVFATMQLLHLPPSTLVMNDPRGILLANEKLYALHFPEVIPGQIVTCDRRLLREFLDRAGGVMILKPLDAAGGEGVFLLRRGDTNLSGILDFSTAYGTKYVMAQHYIPEAREGDKRVILLDGEPIGAVLRVPPQGDHRGNIHIGASVRKAEITPRDREIAAYLAPRLRADGLYFVGLDILGGLLSEVNVTSPTGVQEINRLDGVRLETRIIDFMETRLAQRRGETKEETNR